MFKTTLCYLELRLCAIHWEDETCREVKLSSATTAMGMIGHIYRNHVAHRNIEIEQYAVLL